MVTPLLGHVAIGERLLRVHSDTRHVAGGHMALGHPGTGLLGEVGACGLLGGVNRVGVVDAIIAGGGLRGVQAGLESLSADRHDAREEDARTLRMPYLNQVLALGLCDERLKLGRGEGVDQPGFRHDQKQDLGACENRELVGLVHTRTVLASLFPNQYRARGGRARADAKQQQQQVGLLLLPPPPPPRLLDIRVRAPGSWRGRKTNEPSS